MPKRFHLATAIVLSLSGCATASKDITAQYISPMQYSQYDCPQLVAELGRIQGRVNQLGGRLDEAASNDKTITGVGAILFWPALFALGGTEEQEAEYARLKGEHDAVIQAAVMKKCDGVVASSTTPTSDDQNNPKRTTNN
jgi:hypothetical protein